MSEKSQPRPVMAAKKDVPRLMIRGPVALGLAALSLFAGACYFLAGGYEIDRVVQAPGALELTDRVTPVRHDLGGTIAQLYVGKGDFVQPGQILARLRNAALDAQIDELQASAGKSRARLSAIRAATAVQIAERRRANRDARTDVGALAKQVAQLETEAAALTDLIVEAENKILRTEIRATVAGRIGTIKVEGRGSALQAGAALLTIVTPAQQLLVNGSLARHEVENLRPGSKVRIVLTDMSGRRLHALDARLRSLDADEAGSGYAGLSRKNAVFEIMVPRSQIANQIAVYSGTRAEILIDAGSQTLLEQIAGPLLNWLSQSWLSQSWLNPNRST